MSCKLQLEEIDVSSIKGKSVLIVGGGTGAGLASALALAKAGARVTIADNAPHRSLVDSFRSERLAVQFVKCDVTSWSQQLMAFKQAIQFAPSRSLDIVCSFLLVDKRQDLADEPSHDESRIDLDPSEPFTDDANVNVKAVCNLTRLAMHFFRLPDRMTALKRVRSRSGSTGTSLTASSVRSRSHSRSESRPRSRSGSGSRSGSPVPATQPAESSEAIVITEEPEQKDEEKPDDKEPERGVVFTKSLVITCGMSAYVDDTRDSLYTTSSFALRGLFRSLRARCKDDSSIRINLVSTWATRETSTELTQAKTKDDGVVEETSINGTTEAKDDKQTAESDKPVEEDSKPAEELIDSIPNETGESDKADETQTVTETTETVPKPADESSQADQLQEVPEVSSSNANYHQGTEGAPESSADAIKPDEQNPVSATQDKEKDEGKHTDSTNGSAETANEPSSSAATAAPTTATESSAPSNKDTHFVSMEDVASTVIRLCADNTISGRAIAVMPEGAFDLNDDHEGGYAGEEVKKLLTMRKDAGDSFCKTLNLGDDKV